MIHSIEDDLMKQVESLKDKKISEEIEDLISIIEEINVNVGIGMKL